MDGKRKSRKSRETSSSSSSRSSSSSYRSSSGSGSDSDSSVGPGSPASSRAGVDPDSGSGAGTAGGSSGNAFANDGSFMELFKKKMEDERRKREQEELKIEHKAQDKKASVNMTSFVGKRRGGAKLALKTGMVAKKQKTDTETEPGKGDAWSKYMAEVKKYKAHQCGDDDKTRPLVK